MWVNRDSLETEFLCLHKLLLISWAALLHLLLTYCNYKTECVSSNHPLQFTQGTEPHHRNSWDTRYTKKVLSGCPFLQPTSPLYFLVQIQRQTQIPENSCSPEKCWGIKVGSSEVWPGLLQSWESTTDLSYPGIPTLLVLLWVKPRYGMDCKSRTASLINQISIKTAATPIQNNGLSNAIRVSYQIFRFLESVQESKAGKQN